MPSILTTLVPTDAAPEAAHPATTAPRPSRGGTRRVLVVIRWPVGGIRTHILYTYPTLIEAGYRFTFLVPDDETLPTFARSLEGLPGCEFVGAPACGKRCSLRGTVRRLAREGRFGLIHSHGLTAAVHAVLGNLGIDLPHLTTLHDVFRPDQFAGLKGRVKRWLLARLVGRIGTVVSVGQDVQANLLEYLPSTGCGPRLRIIPNGIDTGHYSDTASAERGLRARLGRDDDPLVLGFLGRFMEQKGVTTLLQALEKLRREGRSRPFHLVAVGSGDRRAHYLREAEQRGLAGCVTALDFTPDALPLLRQLDLLVVPSLWEASPLLPMEAMCVGVPVLGSDCIGLREVLRGTPSRQFPAGDAAALAEALRAAMARPWTAAARDFAPQARARFDVGRRAGEFVAEFDRLFGRATTAGSPVKVFVQEA